MQNQQETLKLAEHRNQATKSIFCRSLTMYKYTDLYDMAISFVIIFTIKYLILPLTYLSNKSNSSFCLCINHTWGGAAIYNSSWLTI